MEVLDRIAAIARDFLGVLDEATLRANVVLFYELLDELIDGGYPQACARACRHRPRACDARANAFRHAAHGH